jgi:predicted ester cyclase
VATPDAAAKARRFFRAWHWDLSVIDELAHADIKVRYPLLGELHGAEAFKRALRLTHERFPDFEFQEEEPIVDGNRIAISWRGGGTHSAPLLGIPPTGIQVIFSGVTLYRLNGGRVVEERGEEDVLAILRQLGAMPTRSAR